MNKKFTLAIIILVTVYVLSYVAVRESNVEFWEKDGNAYVIYPENKIAYYLFRPSSYIDERLTGIRSHIGPHR